MRGMNRILKVWAVVLLLTPTGWAVPNQKAALSRANMDTSVKAGNDFYRYSNGKWMDANPIPGAYARWTAFDELRENNRVMMKKLVDNILKLKDVKRGTPDQQIRDLFRLGMDQVRRNKEGLTALKFWLDKVDRLEKKDDIPSTLAWLNTWGIRPVFNFYGSPDKKNSEMTIAQISQGGLGLPDRDYYLNKGKRYADMRNAYVKHLEAMFKLMGDDADTALAHASVVMKFETRLAMKSMTRVERRNPHKTYHKMRLAELSKLSPSFNWRMFFDGVRLKNPGDINVGQPEFVKELGAMLNEVPLKDWKTYLRWNLINSTAGYLSADFEAQDFEFYGKFLSGKQEMEENWKRVLGTVNRSMGEALGQLYVKAYFPASAKNRMLKLVGNLKVALGERIRGLEWMSEPTRIKALEKLDAIRVKIGYPDKWRDYRGLQIKSDSYVRNVLRARKFNFEWRRAKIGKPVDRDEWHMYPQTVNAYYNPSNNEIVFPAAILQFPFFNMEADDAVNYGAVGVVIGHEMTHGFDDQGRQYDKYGNLKDWWTKADSDEFNKRAAVLAEQYDGFSVGDGEHVNGKLTLGENIADLGGILVAFQAWKNSLGGKPVPKIDGFTGEQRFFLGFSQIWRGNIRQKELLRRVKEDVHSPAEFRVNGPLRNVQAFYDAFGVKEGDAMYLPKTKWAVIW
jgi:putative endopeptidase